MGIDPDSEDREYRRDNGPRKDKAMSVVMIGVTRNIIARIGDAKDRDSSVRMARAIATEDMQVWGYFLIDETSPNENGTWRLWSIKLDDWSPQDVHDGPFDSLASLFKW